MPVPDGIEQVDGVPRCWWGSADALYRRYHDDEWGVPTHDDVRLFEKICLEGFQSGLSWLTILRKRDNFRAAFDGFDFRRIATYEEADVQRLLGDVGIVRHQGKIRSTVNNAARALEIVEAFGSLDAYFWQFVPPPEERPAAMTKAALSTLNHTPTSRRLAADLKRRGFTFIGPTTAYAFMQAMGLVDDHLEGCAFRRTKATT